MRTTDAFTHFGSAAKVAEALSISRPAVSKWRDVVPYASALRLAELSGGALQVDASLYDVHLRPVRVGSETRVA